MKTRLLPAVLATLLAVPAFSAAAVTEGPAATTQARAYLGVLLEPVPHPLRAQLGAVLPPAQGIMIERVMADSPAARAGLKSYDVVVDYNDQKLYSSEQLRHLVRSQRPGTTAALRVVHDGAAEQVRVTLGKLRQTARPSGDSGMTSSAGSHHPQPYWMLPGSEEHNWDSFDSLSLKKLKNGRYRAEIEFTGRNGKLAKEDFKGSRDAIRKQIVKQKDLPRIERRQLLEALSARDTAVPMPPWFSAGMYSPQWPYLWQPDF